jgi:hypothetical protein
MVYYQDEQEQLHRTPKSEHSPTHPEMDKNREEVTPVLWLHPL